MSAVAAIDAVQSRISAIEMQLAMRRQMAATGAPGASGTSSVSGSAGSSAVSSALGVSAVADAAASLGLSTASGTTSDASAIAQALGLSDGSTNAAGTADTSAATGSFDELLASLGVDPTSLGSGLTGTSAMTGTVTGTSTGAGFDQVFGAAVQRLRSQWTATGVGVAPASYATPVSGAASTTVQGVAVDGSVSATTPYASLFEAAGARYGIPPKVLAAIGWVESRYRTDAVSSAGAVGMMQFLPGTAASMGVDPYDPASAIDGTARYLRSALDRFGDLGEAIAAYNVGPGAIANAGGVQSGTQAERYLTKVVEATARV
jgi:peptidoglycan DL-endopeptidase CwlO